ncbi:MAG: hypothetical protein U0169_22955 [Polyangiaceae bacterium]
MANDDGKAALKLTFSGVQLDVKPSDHYLDADWKTILFGVLWTFEAVAGADKKIDEKERAAFASFLAQDPPGKLAAYVFTAVRNDLAALTEARAADKRDAAHGLTDVDTLLRRYPHRDEARELKQAFLDLGARIAESSGGGLFGLGSKVSEEETNVMERMRKMFSLPPRG